MLTLSHIFLGLTSSTFVSYLYVLIQYILCLICIGPYCIFTATLLKHRFITNGPLYGVSYLHAAWLSSMAFSFTL